MGICPLYSFEPHPPEFTSDKMMAWKGRVIDAAGIHKCYCELALLPFCGGDMKKCALYEEPAKLAGKE